MAVHGELGAHRHSDCMAFGMVLVREACLCDKKEQFPPPPPWPNMSVVGVLLLFSSKSIGIEKK